MADSGLTWKELPERNEFSISIKVDSAEHKTFVPSLADAWVTKARTWMSWSGSVNGYHDNADDTIFDTMVAGATIQIRFYDTRTDMTKYWQGPAILTNVNHGTNPNDFSTLSVDFEGQGPLTRVS